MNKRQAREIALHTIFQLDFKNQDFNELLAQTLSNTNQVEDFDFYNQIIPDVFKLYIKTVTSGISQNFDTINNIIKSYSKGWDISRISKVSLAILRLAIFEIKFMPDIPVGASINEAVELAKIYDADDTTAFINGILGSFARDISKDE